MFGSKPCTIPLYPTITFKCTKRGLIRSRMNRRLNRQRKPSLNRLTRYAVVHGGCNKELRQLSVDFLSALPFDGYAVGGSLGSCHEELVDLLNFTIPKLPGGKPNHLLGIADERSILAAVPLGVDTFDSCFPTRLARHGTLLTKNGKLHVAADHLYASYA